MFLNMEASEGRETERMAESAIQSAADTLTYFLRQKDFYLSHTDVWVMSLRNKLKALLKDVDGMRWYNESVQLIEVANNTKNVIDSFIFKVTGETSYQSTFNSGIKDKPAIEDLGKKISHLKRRLDEIILSNRSQYGIHNIQPSGEASTSSNQIQIQREKRAPNLKRRLDEIILPNSSQYGIHNIQPSGEASTSSNQIQIQREKRAPNLKRRLDEIILPNRSQYGIHNIQPSGEASTSSNQGQMLSNRSWQLNDREDGRPGTFALSYDDLPNYLKPCFLYFGAFPENSEIWVDELIRIWIAEGFVQRRGEKEMEDVAEDYVEELISRSMIQVSERKSNGMLKKCCINNHLRDLAISKAEDERFLEVYGNKVPTSSIMADRLAITSGDISNCISLNSSTPHLLSLLDFSYESGLPEKLALKIQGGAFKFLRVMHLQSKKFFELPDEIGDLIHLRYLCLEIRWLRNLPSTITRLANLWLRNLTSTITRLANLQTLEVRHSCELDWQLDDIVKLELIRHLMVRNIRFSNSMQLHHLSNLRTLGLVKAGSWIEDGLEKLTNLRDLGIYEIRGDVHKALSRSVSKLVHLRSLRLSAHSKSWIPAFESFSKHEHLYEMILEGRLEKLPEPHVFPPNLTKLCLCASELAQDPMVTLEKLPNLRSLCIYSISLGADAYMGKEMVCSAGGFPLLDTLTIYGFHELEEWRVEEGAMRNLRCFEISYCKRLKMLPDGLRYIITLQKLKLEYMSEELKKRVRKNKGEDWFKIRHIPSLIIKNW